MFVCAVTSLVIAFIPFAFGDNLTDILHALNSSSLDQFSNATASLNGTTAGQNVLAQLSRGNMTIFAPTDDAWSGRNKTNETLADIIAYHVVYGNFVNETATYPNETIGRTLLKNSSLVTLEGNQSQVLVWSKADNGSLFVSNQAANVTVVNATSFNNTAILAVDSVLALPPNISTVLNDSAYNLSLVTNSLGSTSFPNGFSVLDALSSAHGITLFAPNNAAIQAAQGPLAGLSNNVTALLDLLFNHIINGTSVYSTEMPTGRAYKSASGQDYDFVDNSTGTFVSVGGSNQVRIVEPNVLTSNGVIQIVDGVMLDTTANAAAASSAFASATSVAAHETQTGAVTATSHPTSSLSPSPTSGARAMDGDKNWKMGALAGMIVGVGPMIAI